MTSLRVFNVPEVLSVQEVPSEEVKMFPLEPTETNDTVELSVLVVLSVLLQEMIVKLRNRERIMSICLIRFLIGYFRKTLHIPKLGGFYKNDGECCGGSLTAKNSFLTMKILLYWNLFFSN